jgi:glycosyltransferase involved in cell wall biosynthesis
MSVQERMNGKEDSGLSLDSRPDIPAELGKCLIERRWPGRSFAYSGLVRDIQAHPCRQDAKASLIVVADNPDKKCIAALSRLLNDTACPVHLIVLDNASSSPLLQPLSEMGQTYIRLTRRVNSAVARNVGALFAQAPLLVFLADDICPAPNLAAVYANCAAEREALVIRGRLSGTQEVEGAAMFRFDRSPLDHAWCADLPDNMAVDAAVFFQLGGFDETFACGESLDFSIKLYARNQDMPRQWYCAAASCHAASTFSVDARLLQRRDAWSALNRKYGGDLLPFVWMLQNTMLEYLESAS